MDQPLVSIIAVTRNHELFCVESLNSILNQSYKNLEWIILDAASTDQTPKIIDSWLVENNIDSVFLKEKALKPITVNLNKALKFVKGDYIQFISLDDMLMEEKIESQIEFFEKDSQIGMLFGDAIVINEDSNPVGQIFGVNNKKYEQFDNSDWFEKLSTGNYICAPTSLLRTKVFLSVGNFDPTLNVEDWDLWLRLLKTDFKVKYKCSLNTKYRKTNTSLWHNKNSKVLLSMFDTIRKNRISDKTFLVYIWDYKKFKYFEKVKFIFGLIKRKSIIYVILTICLSFIGERNGVLQYYKKIKRVFPN